jgi:hypothetical protein
VAKNKAFLSINADTVEVSALEGFLTTLSADVKTDVNMSPVLDFAFNRLSTRFDNYMSAVAPTAPQNFHHVYDWNHIGNQQFQLWKNVMRGRGGTKYASFEFRASRLPVPVPDVQTAKPFNRTHRFIYKAMIMEYNINVTIRPKKAKILVFPLPDGKLMFTKGPIFIKNPGGKGTTGAFTSAWSEWWGGPGAKTVFRDEINRSLESDFSETALGKFMRRFRKAKTRSVAISVADKSSAFEQGAGLAREFLVERARKNALRSKQ